MLEWLGFGIDGLILRLVAGAIIGFCIGLTGVGGGVLVLPTLTVLFKMDAAMAVGTASLYSFLTKAAATGHHLKLKTIDLRRASLFLLGAVPANIVVSIFITKTVAKMEQAGQSASLETFQSNLKLFIAVVILFSCVLLILNTVKALRKKDKAAEMGALAAAITGNATLNKIVPVILGLVVGALIGATSVGGGVLIIPMLIIFLGMTASQTVGTSIFIAVVLTLVTSLIFLIGGQLDYVTAITMAVAAMAGVPFGSKLSVKMPEQVLKIVVIGVIIFAVILMFTGHGGGH